MQTRGKILFGVAALALAATSFAVFGAPDLFAGASTPSFPVACKISATVTFNPPLTLSGTQTTNRAAVTTTTISGGHLTGCLSAAPLGAPGHGTLPDLTVNTPATSLGRIGGVKTYATGYCPAYSGTSSLKAFNHVVFTVTWTGGAGGFSTFTTKKVSVETNSDSELGLVFSAKEGFGSYTEKPLNQITLFFDATTSAAIDSHCSANQVVSSGTIDPTNSVVIL
jgi:hypothetical protein